MSKKLQQNRTNSMLLEPKHFLQTFCERVIDPFTYMAHGSFFIVNLSLHVASAIRRLISMISLYFETFER